MSSCLVKSLIGVSMCLQSRVTFHAIKWMVKDDTMGIFRMEKLKSKSISSLAKSLGTLVSIAGALVVTFYRGPAIMISSPSTLHQQLLASQQASWIIGGVLLAADCVLTSAWLILQVSL